MFTAKEIIGADTMEVINPKGAYRKTFFWSTDKQDKKKVAPLQDWNVFDYVDKFLPAFGFYTYRDPNDEEGDYRVIQRNGRFVRVIGGLKETDVRDKIFRWTLHTLKYLCGVAGDLPPYEQLKQKIMTKSALFSSYTLKFLSELPEVETSVPDQNGDLKTMVVPQRPLRDGEDQSNLCFRNCMVVIRADREPICAPYSILPPEIFVWDSQVRPYEMNDEVLERGPHGVWWDFCQNLSKELRDGKWVVNMGMLKTLTTAYGYLIHDYRKPDLRKAVVLYDRTSGVREGGAGKSIFVDGINAIRPYFWRDGKRFKGEMRFLMEGYTDDKRVVVFSDIRKDFDLEEYYNMITDGFSVEGKGKPLYLISKKSAPKVVINTNYTIPAVSRSDRRRLFFVPISQFYGVLRDSKNLSPADVHGGMLVEENWSHEDWTSFYATCIHCAHEYLKDSLVPFDDNVLLDRQLLAAAGGNDNLLMCLQEFIEEVAKSGGECTREMVLDVYDKNPELEYARDYKPRWKVSKFKNIALGMGFQVNPGRDRYQRNINGKVVDCFVLVRAGTSGSDSFGLDMPNEETPAPAPTPSSPPVVKEGRFSDFLFDTKEAGV